MSRFFIIQSAHPECMDVQPELDETGFSFGVKELDEVRQGILVVESFGQRLQELRTSALMFGIFRGGQVNCRRQNRSRSNELDSIFSFKLRVSPLISSSLLSGTTGSPFAVA